MFIVSLLLLLVATATPKETQWFAILSMRKPLSACRGFRHFGIQSQSYRMFLSTKHFCPTAFLLFRLFDVGFALQWLPAEVSLRTKKNTHWLRGRKTKFAASSRLVYLSPRRSGPLLGCLKHHGGVHRDHDGGRSTTWRKTQTERTDPHYGVASRRRHRDSKPWPRRKGRGLSNDVSRQEVVEP
jgi:hypothetical protein